MCFILIQIMHTVYYKGMGLSKTQKELLSVYKTYQKFCKSHKLRFFAYAGTALGTVRHKGFIPWDDDIDVLMPLPDYDAFTQAVNETSFLADNNLGLFNGIALPVSDKAPLRLFSNTSMFTSNDLITQPQSFVGLYVDIIPLIGIPDTTKEQQKFLDELLQTLTDLWYHKLFSHDSKKIAAATKRYLAAIYKYPYEKSTYVIPIDKIQLENKQIIYKREDFDTPKEAPFEKGTMYISPNFDIHLSEKFGDYMKYPPQSQQVSHHASYALFDQGISHTAYREAFAEDTAQGQLIRHLASIVQSLRLEKMDLLSRIPPLEQRIAEEIKRNEQQSHTNTTQPTIKQSIKLLIKAVRKRIKRLF